MKIFMTEMYNQYKCLTRVLAAAGLINNSPTGHREIPFTLSGDDGKHPLQFAREISSGREEEKVIM